jgi:hypothetical protein
MHLSDVDVVHFWRSRGVKKTGIWYVTNFVDAHNHDLAKPDHVHVLWSHPGLNDAQKAEAIALSQGGLHPFKIMDVI